MIKKRTMFCYGFLAMPLAFIALSLFVFVPKIYHEQYGISLVTLITIFIITKLINFALIPYIGIYLDKLNLKRIYRKKPIYICLPLMILSFYFLIFPPFESISSLIFFYLITCTLYSVVAINYYAISIELTREYRTQNYLSGYRELFSLFGFMFATMLPTILMQKYSFAETYNNIIFLLIFVTFTAGILMHFVKSKHTFVFHPELNIKQTLGLFSKPDLRRFLLVTFINAIGSALPVTTSIFFIKYVINAENLTGYYLMTFYFCAILSIPFWTKFSNKNGKKYSWIISMIVSACFFFAAYFLGEGDRLEYYVICIATGFCFGADLCLSPSIFSDNTESKEKSAIYYSLWILTIKAAVTICVITSLVVLGYYGLEAHHIQTEDSLEKGAEAISTIYTFIPALLKIVAASLFLANKVDIKFKHF